MIAECCAIVASSGSRAVALAVFGIAAVVAVSAAFYAVGRGEDRDRQAASARADEDSPGPAARPSELDAPKGERSAAHPRRPRPAARSRRRRP